MSSANLLSHFDRIADAPDAAVKLRHFVIELSVRGKLTSANGVADETEILGELATFVMGQAPPGDTSNELGDGTLFVKVGEFGLRYPEERVWTTKPLKLAKDGDVLICVVGATVGKLNLGIDCAIGRSVAAIRPGPRLDAKYLYLSLMPFTLRLREGARGSAQGVITKSDLAAVRIWVPSLSEQARVVAKVDELLALCDQLERDLTAIQAESGRLLEALIHEALAEVAP